MNESANKLKRDDRLTKKKIERQKANDELNVM